MFKLNSYRLNRQGFKPRLKQLKLWLSHLTRAERFRLAARVVVYSFLLLATASTIYFVFFKAAEAGAAWFDESWLYRKEVTVTNSGSAQTDFQVQITLDTATLITAGKMQSDCDDVRVTDSSGGSLLNHWTESGTNACNTSTTAIWAKVPSLVAGTNTLYVYYGNPSALSASNGNNVFQFFDDFSLGSVDATKWNTSGTISQTGGEVILDNSDILVSKNTTTDSAGLGRLVFRAKQAATTLTGGKVGFSDTASTSAHYSSDDAANLVLGSTEEQVSTTGSTNLVSHHQLEETTSTDANQFKASGYLDTGKLSQAVSMYGNAAGTVGSKLTFNRGAQISGNNYERLNANQGTVSFWVKGGAWANDGQEHGFLSNSSTTFYVYKSTTNLMKGRFDEAAARIVQADVSSWTSTSVWHLVTFRWDADNIVSGSNYLDLWLDGTQYTAGENQTSSWTPPPLDTITFIGSRGTGDKQANTLIDDFAIFDRVLTTTEITALYNSGSGAEAGSVGDPSLKFYAKLDGSGTLSPVTYNAGASASKLTAASGELTGGTNIFLNGNVESATGGAPTSWIKIQETGGTITWADAEAANILYDTRSQKVTHSGGCGSGGCEVGQQVTLTGGSTYTLNFWYKLTAGAYLYPRIYNSTSGVDEIATNQYLTSSSWAKWETVFKVTGSGSQTVKVGFRKSFDASDTTFYLDNVSLVTNLVDNGGMEGTYVSGLAPNWTKTGTPTVASDTGRTGTYAQQMTSGDWSNRIGQTIGGLTSGKSYTLSFWAKRTAGSGTFVGITFTSWASLSFSTLTTSWQRFSAVVTAQGTDAATSFYGNDAGTTFDIDDVSLVPLDPVGASFQSWTPVPDRATTGSELITNGTMESGNPPSNWLAGGGGSAILSRSSDQAPGATGSYSLNAQRGTTDTSAYQNFTTVTGRTYYYSVWGKNVDASTGAQYYVYDNTNLSYLKNAAITGTTTWTNIAGYFTATSTSTQFGLLVVGSTGQNAKFDDVTVKEVADPLSVHGDSDGVTSMTSGARNNAYTFDGSTGYLRQKTYATNIGTLSYSGNTLTDSGQTFTGYKSATSPATASYMIVVTNSDNTTSWGYLGNAGEGATVVTAYTTKGTTAAGWNGTSPSGKTPVGYEIRKTDYQITGSLTVGAWVKPATLNDIQPILSKYNDSSSNASYHLDAAGHIAGDPFRFLVSNDGTTMVTRQSAASATTSNWQFVIGVYNSSAQSLDIYVNGALSNDTLSGTVPSSILDSSHSFRMAKRVDGESKYGGSIDSPMVFSTALTADQIKDIYNSTASHYGLVTNNETANAQPANSSTPTNDVAYHTYLINSGSASAVLSQDNTTIATSSSNLPNEASYVRLQNASASALTLDWIGVAKQATTAPGTPSVSGTESIGPGPTSYWRFDEGYGTTAYDAMPSANNGTISGATWQSEDQCISGKCLYFDGSNDSVIVADPSNNSLDPTSAYTLSAWVRFMDTTNYGFIISKSNNGGDGGYELFRETSLGRMRFSSCNIGGVCSGGYFDTQTTSQYNDGKWHLVTASAQTNSTAKIYIDGNLVQESGTITQDNIQNSTALSIGQRAGNSQIFKGFIDEVKIYNYARSASQVRGDYLARGTPRGVSALLSRGSNPGALADGLVGYWKMDEASWNGTAGEVIDASGNSNNGTAGYTGASSYPTTAVGKFGNAGSFTGSGTNPDTVAQYFQVTSSTSLNSPTTELTLSARVNLTSLPTEYATVATKGCVACGASQVQYYVSIGSTGNVSVSASDGTSSNNRSTTDAPISAGSWYHLVYTFKGGTPRIFVNGAENTTGSTAGSATSIQSTARPFRVGESDYINRYGLTGKVDDVRVYNRALSPKEVRDLYNWAPGPVGYWNFDENTGTNVQDRSSNTNTGTWSGTGTHWTTGKFGSAGKFNGSDDFVSTAFSWSSLNNGTMEAWVKPNATGNFGILGTEASGSNNYLLIWNSNTLAYCMVNGTQFSKSYAFSVGSWYHLACTKTGTTGEIFVNGISLGTGTVGSSFYSSNLRIGVSGASSNLLNGQIDDIRIYNYARTGKQIVEDMNAGHPAVGSPVGSQVGYWKLDEGQGPKANSSVWSQAGTTANLATNPSFETALTGWANGNNTTVTRDTTTGYFGTSSMKVVFSGGGGGWAVNYPSLSPSTTYTFSYWAKGNGIARANFYTAETGDVGGTDTTLSSTAWTRLSVTATTGGTVTNAQLQVRSNDPTNPTVYADGIQLEVASSKTPYCDGSLTGNGTHSWSGTAHASTSTCAYGQDGELNNGVAWTNSGKFGKALSFDGVDDYFEVPDSSTNDLGTLWTISFWIKPTYKTSPEDYGVIISKGTGVDSNMDGIRFDAGGARMYATRGENDFVNYLLSNDIPSGSWGHVSIVMDSSSYIYVNGVRKATGSTVIDFMNKSANLRIGDPQYDFWNSGPVPFSGSIDEVKVYNYALTEDEVRLDYNRGLAIKLGSASDKSAYEKDAANQEYCIPGDTASCASPVGEWNFEENSGNYAFDTSGNVNTGTLGASADVGSDDPAWKAGKVGGALSFDGGDHVRAADSSSLDPTTITIEAWIKPTAEPGSYQPIVSKANVSTNQGYWLNLNNGRTVRFIVGNASTYLDFSTTATISNDIWTHIVASYDGTNGRIYFNGVLMTTSSTFTDGMTVLATKILTIGADTNDSNNPVNYFVGSIDQARIYNYARSAAQVAWDYNRGNPVGWWRMDECQGSTAYDASGNSNNGTITIGATGTQTSAGTCTTSGTAWYNGATGKYNSSLNFDGTDDYVSGPDTSGYLNGNGTSRTVSAWIYQAAAAQKRVLGVFDGQGSSTPQYSLFVTDAGLIRIQMRNAAGDYIANSHYSVNTFSTGAWQHIAFTYDMSQLKIYLNGKLDNTYNVTGSIRSDASPYFYIGQRGDGGGTENFNGRIDDARIYNYALTATQIKLLYNENFSTRFGPLQGSP